MITVVIKSFIDKVIALIKFHNIRLPIGVYRANYNIG